MRLSEAVGAWPRGMTLGMLRGGWDGEVSSRCLVSGCVWVAERERFGLCILGGGREHSSGEEAWRGRITDLCVLYLRCPGGI